ncbi:MAG: rod shape-determining protein [Blautia sp.]
MPFHKTFGIDLGTSMVKIYSCQNDTILKEKNMIAIRNESQILASGNDAFEIFEKNPSNVSVITPMAFGKVANVNYTELVLHSLLEKAGAGSVFGNTLYLAVPADLSEIEKRAYYTIGNSKRKNKIYMIEKPIADAVALGIPINHTKGTMIVNMGAQSTEISILEKGRVVISKIIEIGGKQLNEAIVNAVRRNCSINIGNKTARRLKFELAWLKTDMEKSGKIIGVDCLTGLPQESTISSYMIHDAIQVPLTAVCKEIRFLLERIPPQIYTSIADEGIFLTGGSTKLPDIAWFVSQHTEMRVRLSDFYDLCTIYGIKEIIGNKTLWKWVK